MTKEDRDIQRKLKVLRHAAQAGHVAKTCRHFGVGRSSFYRWKAAYDQRGEAGLVNAKPIPKNPANRRHPRSSKRSFTCVANITSGRSGSSGTGALSRHHNLRRRRNTHSAPQWRSSPAAWNAHAQSPHQVL